MRVATDWQVPLITDMIYRVEGFQLQLLMSTAQRLSVQMRVLGVHRVVG
jgi:hypothetical protein